MSVSDLNGERYYVCKIITFTENVFYRICKQITEFEFVLYDENNISIYIDCAVQIIWKSAVNKFVF